MRRNLNSLFTQPDVTVSHVELVEYIVAAPATSAALATQHPLYVEGTLDLYRNSDNHQYIQGTDFEETPPDSFTNLTITAGTAIRVEYLVDLSGSSTSTSEGGGESGGAGYYEPMVSGDPDGELVFTEDGDIVMGWVDEA